MHALGVAEGLVLNGNSVDFIGGDGLTSFKDDLPSDGVNLIELKETKKGFLGFLAWNYKVFKKVREVSKLNNYESLIVRYAISSYILLLFIGIFINIRKKVIEVNSFAFHHFALKFPLFNKIIVFFEIYLSNFYDVLYVVSDKMALDKRNKRFKGIVISIYNGATSKKINFVENITDNKKTRLVYLGSLMDYWDYMSIIQAVKGSNNLYELHFFGDGPSLKSLQNQMKELSNVKYHRFHIRQLQRYEKFDNTEIIKTARIKMEQQLYSPLGLIDRIMEQPSRLTVFLIILNILVYFILFTLISRLIKKR